MGKINIVILFAILGAVIFSGCYDAQYDRVTSDNLYGGHNVKTNFYGDSTKINLPLRTAITPDKGILIAGKTWRLQGFPRNYYDVENTFVMKIDSLGNQVWERNIDSDYARHINIIAIQPDSTIFLVIDKKDTTSHSNPKTWITILHLSQSGEFLAEKTFKMGKWTSSRYLVKTTGQDYLLMGDVTNSLVKQDSYTFIMRLNSMGDSIHTVYYRGMNTIYFRKLLKYSDNLFYHLGTYYRMGNLDEPLTYLFCFNSNGDSLWSRTYPELKLDRYDIDKMFVSADSTIIAIGSKKFVDKNQKYHPVYNWFTMLKFDKNGDLTVLHDGSSAPDISPSDVVQLEDGSLIIAGDSHDKNNFSQKSIMRVGQNGKIIWEKPLELAHPIKFYSWMYLCLWTDGNVLLVANTEYVNGKMFWARELTHCFAIIDSSGNIVDSFFGGLDRTVINAIELVDSGQIVTIGQGFRRNLKDPSWYGFKQNFISDREKPFTDYITKLNEIFVLRYTAVGK